MILPASPIPPVPVLIKVLSVKERLRPLITISPPLPVPIKETPGKLNRSSPSTKGDARVEIPVSLSKKMSAFSASIKILPAFPELKVSAFNELLRIETKSVTLKTIFPASPCPVVVVVTPMFSKARDGVVITMSAPLPVAKGYTIPEITLISPSPTKETFSVAVILVSPAFPSPAVKEPIKNEPLASRLFPFMIIFPALPLLLIGRVFSPVKSKLENSPVKLVIKLVILSLLLIVTFSEALITISPA